MSATSDSKPLALAVRPRGKPIARLPDETYAEPSDSGHDVYIRIAAKSRLSPHRLRITKASDGSLVPDRADTSIDSLGLYDQSSVFVKDLGKPPLPPICFSQKHEKYPAIESDLFRARCGPFQVHVYLPRRKH